MTASKNRGSFRRRKRFTSWQANSEYRARRSSGLNDGQRISHSKRASSGSGFRVRNSPKTEASVP